MSISTKIGFRRDAAPRFSGRSASLEPSPADFREQHERSVNIEAANVTPCARSPASLQLNRSSIGLRALGSDRAARTCPHYGLV